MFFESGKKYHEYKDFITFENIFINMILVNILRYSSYSDLTLSSESHWTRTAIKTRQEVSESDQ